MVLISFWQSSASCQVYNFLNIELNSDEEYFEKFLFIRTHRLSFGLKSGLEDSQFRTSISFSSSQFLCWKIYSPQPDNIKVPSMIFPTPFEDIHPHTMRITRNLTVRFKHYFSLAYCSIDFESRNVSSHTITRVSWFFLGLKNLLFIF